MDYQNQTTYKKGKDLVHKIKKPLTTKHQQEKQPNF